MPWRGVFVVAAGLLTGGCLLSAYQIASWTVSGVSYAFSGKGVGDHALSLATSKDCATWRILQGEEVCVDYGSDFEGVWSALASSWSVPDILSQPEAVADADGVAAPVIQSASGVDPAAVQAVALPVRLDTTPRRAESSGIGLDFNGLVAPSGGVELEDGEASWLDSAGVAPALDFGGLTPSGDAVKRASARSIATSAPAIYLVLGSFRDRENADALRARHAGRNMHVMKTRADNRMIFRVLTGPIAAAVLTETRVDIAKAGIRNAWAVRLCAGSLAPPPCEPVLQQASLPGR